MTINCKGTLIDLSIPKVMGILNLTPDSFYDGGEYGDETSVLRQVELMLNEGAAFIDIGAYSSRPGASIISEKEEETRLLPLLSVILNHFPETLISIDTFRAGIAKKAVQQGAAIINDISAGLRDARMFETIRDIQVPYIMMHLRGTSQTMQSLTQYDDVVRDIIDYFIERIEKARRIGVNDLIIDPGFGFAKTIEQNFEFLDRLQELQLCELPILVGLSRKSMIYKTLNVDASKALNGTTALHMKTLEKGVNILRVHDVKEAVETIKLWKSLSTNANSGSRKK